MGEMDDKPVDTEASVFRQETDQLMSSGLTIDREEVEKERRVKDLEKELVNARIELEARHVEYEAALLRLVNEQKTTDELTLLLRTSDFQKDFYINESEQAEVRINELESSMAQMTYHLSESEDAKAQLARSTTELNNMNSELNLLRKAKEESSLKSEAMESALSEEKQRNEELLRHLLDMNEAIAQLQTKAIQIEQEKAEALSAKEDTLELVEKATSEAEKQLEIIHGLENQVVEKSEFIDSLQLELEKVNVLHASSQKAASETSSELGRLKEEIELTEKKNLDQAAYISLLETELKQLKMELGNVNSDTVRLNEHSEQVKAELERVKEKENDAQVEIALMKFELHKGRSKLAAAEASEVRVQAEKSALYNALQQMGLEAEEIKRENRALKAMKVEHSKEINAQESHDNAVIENKKINHGKEGKPEDYLHESNEATENLKKDLEVAMMKIAELRTRAEQAISRAEAAEKSKAVLEDKMKKRKEQKERHKAALLALREESLSRDFGSSDSIKYEASPPKHYHPLSKVLNMKF